MRIAPFELRGRHVHLTPMSAEDVDGLLAAATEDRATYGFTTVPGDVDAMAAHVAGLVALRDRGHDLPFTTRDARDDRIVGSTRFLWLRSYFERDVPDAVEIGGTWLAASAQRSRINTEAKLLMLGHAFDGWRVQRVDLKTDARNQRSRNAIERIGGKLDGVVRNWQPSLVPGEEGTPRDSALYSIVPPEWPAVRATLEGRLSR